MPLNQNEQEAGMVFEASSVWRSQPCCVSTTLQHHLVRKDVLLDSLNHPWVALPTQ
jgi:hypothetical protein